METKKCNGECGQIKPLSEFYRDYRNKEEVVYRSKCKSCVLGIRRINQYASDAEKRNSPEYKNYKKEYDKQRYIENSDEIKTRTRNYRQKPSNKKRRNSLHQKRYETDSFYKFKYNIRSLLYQTLNSEISDELREKRSQEIMQCSWDFAFEYLGNPDRGTHIDHIIPISWAETEEEALALSCIWNLRRISAKENTSKNDSPPDPSLLHPNLSPLALEIYRRNSTQ